MSRPVIDRDRVAIVVLLMAAVAWYLATRWMIEVEGFELIEWPGSIAGGLGPGPPPRGGWGWVFVVPVQMDQAGARGLVHVALGAAIFATYTLGLVRLWRSRRPVSRRLVRLPMRLGLLALVVGVTGAASTHANRLAVLTQLGFGDHWFGTDRASMPWGSLGLLLGGATLAVAGVLLTAILAIGSAWLGRGAIAPERETP